MGKLVKNYIYNIIYQLFILFIPLILSPYLARVIGATRLGVFSYVNSVAALLSTIILLGTYNYGARQVAYIRGNRLKTSSFFWELFWIRIFLGLMGTLVYAILAYSSPYRLYFFLYYIWIFASFIDPSWLFIGEEDMKSTVLKNFFIKGISVIMIFCFVKNEDDLWKYVFIMAASTLVANMALLIPVSKYVDKPSFTFNNFRIHIINSLYLFWPQVTTMLSLQVGKIMINLMSGNSSQVSFYDYGEKIVDIPLTFILVLSTVMMPRIANDYANGNVDKMHKNIMLAGRYSLMLAIPMAIGIASIADGLIPWYLGSEFNPTIYVIIILSPIIISNSLLGISGNQYFTATNQMDILLKSNIITAIMNVIVNVMLIPKFGLYGAAFAAVTSSYISVFIQYINMNKQIKVTTFFGEGFKYLAASLPMTMIIYVIRNYFQVGPLTTFIQVLVGALIYIVTLIIIKDENLILITDKFISAKK